jgi:hypothetical protein
MLDDVKRLIILDFSVYIHTAFAIWQKNPDVPPTYTALSMILGQLARVSVEPDDLVMFVRDSSPCWRADIDSNYKANRTPLPQNIRDEFEIFKQRLDKQTNWIFVGPIFKIESDDIAAVICKHYQNIPEIILITIDSDWEQNYSLHPGVKIFSMKTKQWKIRPDNYNVYEELAHKVHKEVSDNLVTSVTTSEEYDKRLQLVDLTRLPEWVEKSVLDVLSSSELYNKNVYPEIMPSKSLQPRFDNLYNDKSKQIIYEVQKAKQEAKEIRKRNKKAEIKAKAKRKMEREHKRNEKLMMKIKKQKGLSYGKIRTGSIQEGNAQS